MSFALDWLFGIHSEEPPSTKWFDESYDINVDAAPILKLNSAIIQQAVSDGASRIDLRIGVPDLEYFYVETLAQNERRQKIGVSTSDLAKSNADFARVMAEAGVKQGRIEPKDKLSVFYSFGEFAFRAMTIPPNLIYPSIQAYPFYFNFKRCSTMARPENLIYVSSKNRSAFASIDHCDRSGEHKLGICLEYEDDQP